jgi:hypothetical protein
MQIARRRLKPSRWLGYRIELNDLLPDAARIMRRLAGVGIPVDDTFGSSSDDPTTPGRVVIAWGPDIGSSRLREIFTALNGVRVDAISATRDPEDRKKIFIGSYVVSGPGVI